MPQRMPWWMDRLPTTWSRLDRKSVPRGTSRPQRAPRSASTESQEIRELKLLLDAWPRLWPHQWSMRNASCKPCCHRHEQQYHGRQPEVCREDGPTKSGRTRRRDCGTIRAAGTTTLGGKCDGATGGTAADTIDAANATEVGPGTPYYCWDAIMFACCCCMGIIMGCIPCCICGY